jgi:VanZ family protein
MAPASPRSPVPSRPPYRPSGQGGWISWLWAWCPAVLWAGLIFYGSTEVLAANRTSRFLTPFLHWLIPALTDDQIGTVRMVIRKGGHVSEFAVLAVLVWRGFRRGQAPVESWSVRTAGWAWVAATAYAASDEFHQSFQPTRQGSAWDVGIDSMGAAVGLWLLYRVGCWRGWWGRGAGVGP